MQSGGQNPRTDADTTPGPQLLTILSALLKLTLAACGESSFSLLKHSEIQHYYKMACKEHFFFLYLHLQTENQGLYATQAGFFFLFGFLESGFLCVALPILELAL